MGKRENKTYYTPAFTRMTAEDTIPYNTGESYAVISSNLPGNIGAN
jgi:hypothetical protein